MTKSIVHASIRQGPNTNACGRTPCLRQEVCKSSLYIWLFLHWLTPNLIQSNFLHRAFKDNLRGTKYLKECWLVLLFWDFAKKKIKIKKNSNERLSRSVVRLSTSVIPPCIPCIARLEWIIDTVTYNDLFYWLIILFNKNSINKQFELTDEIGDYLLVYTAATASIAKVK